MSVEELMNVAVTSASKKEERLSQTPAAIFVITSDDIRRGGFTSIPDALRTVPGLFVAKINGDWWSVSARGFSDYLNDKMLVLIDGRSVYDLEFGGVEWDQIEIPLEDVERIEVIRGPGGTLWGANAVNGVINIITKKAQASQGILVATSGSPENGEIASVRYGGQVGENLAYRVFGKSEYWDPGLTPAGTNAFDSWNMSQGGMRLDWDMSSKNALTIEGRGYDGHVENETPFFSAPGVPETLLFETFVAQGGDFQANWRHTFSERSYTEIFGYCAWTNRSEVFAESRNTCDVEFQDNYTFNQHHSIVWGGSVLTSGSFKPPLFESTFTPKQRRDTVLSAFGQYEVRIVPDRVSLTGGVKVERNPYSGFEFQPQIRGVWTPSAAHSIWAAVSRGVRVPSESEANSSTILVQEPGVVPTYVATFGNPNLKPEVMRAYEAGYRFQPNRYFSLDADIFYNHYDNLINLDFVHVGEEAPPIVHTNPDFVVIPVPWQNIGPGQTHGAEVYARIRPVDHWEMAIGVTELRGNSVNLLDSLNLPIANTPRHQFNIQSRLDLTRHLSLDSNLYYTGGIPLNVQAVLSQDLHAHFREDLGMSWHEARGFTFSVWGRDLGTASRPESLPALFTTTGSYVQRSVGISLLWQSPPDKANPKR